MGAQARRSLRYARQLDISVDGLEIVTSNVSQGGLQLCCPEMRYQALDRQFNAADTVVIKIRLPATERWLVAVGKRRYADHVDDEYLIGFQITQFNADDESAWSDYMATLKDARPID